MGTTDGKKKKPLVTLEAGNPAEPDRAMQDYTKPETAPIGSYWAGVQQKDDGLPILNEQQLENIQNAPDGVSMNDINKVPGKSTPTISQSAINSGVLAGAPSQVVIQHMLDAERKPRTKEEQEKLDKKRRRDALFAAIGDGVSALSNLYFTTKGSPSADQSKSLSKATRERDEKEDKEYESAMDRRIRLLKEQQEDLNRQYSMRLTKELNDARKEYYGTLGKAKIKDVEGNITYKTKKAKTEEEAQKRKDDREDKVAESLIYRNNQAGNKYGSDAKVNQAVGAAKVSDYNDRKSKRGSSGSKYDPAKDPGMQKVVKKDPKTGTTVTSYERKTPSAKSSFSIHKKR